MKLSLVALATTTTFAVANAAVCDPVKLAPLLADSNVAKCTADSGFSFANPTRPTSEMTTKFCASNACKAVLSKVEGLGLGDCTLFGMQLQSDLITPTQNACAGNSTASGSQGSTAGSTGGGAPTVTNSTTNSTGSGTSGGSTGGAASPITSSSNNGASPNTAGTPAPSTTSSSASSIAMATSVALVAVVAAFL